MDTDQEDIGTWQHKVYLEHPVLCDGDPPIMRFGHWCAGLYPGGTPGRGSSEIVQG